MKFILPFLACFLPAAIGSTDVQPRELVFTPTTDLEKSWMVLPTTLDYLEDTNLFKVETKVGWADNGVQAYSLEIYDDCPNGDPLYNLANQLDATVEVGVLMPAFWIFPEWILSLPWLNGAKLKLDHADTVPPKSLFARWKFRLTPAIVNAANYHEDDNKGYVSFCIRIGSLDHQPGNVDPNPIATLISFSQLKVDVVFDLAAEFSTVDSFTTKVIDPDEADTIEEAFAAEADLCEGYAGPFAQGQEVCIEVCPKHVDDQLSNVEIIQELQMDISTPETTAFMQVLSGGLPSGSTVLGQDCPIATGCCKVTFLLNGEFFPVGEPDDPVLAEVDALGDCLMIVQERRLSTKLRALAASSENSENFKTSFEITSDPRSLESDGESFKTKLAVAAGVAGAALLL